MHETLSAPGFRLENARLTISSLEHTTTIAHLSRDPFTLLFLWVKDKGLFVVSFDGPHVAEEAGLFSENTLHFSCSGLDVMFANDSVPLLSDERERPALITYFPNYLILAPDVRPPDLILGLADEFAQIPGFEYRNLPPASCATDPNTAASRSAR